MLFWTVNRASTYYKPRNRLTLKQKAIFIAVIVAIALVIITAALLMSMISETSTVASDNVDNYIASTEGLDDDAKQLFEDKSSLIGLKISDINEIYNKLIIDNKGGSETQVLMQYEIGENEVKESKYTLKDMVTGNQELLDVDSIVSKIKNNG